jgi:hypothetical protein
MRNNPPRNPQDVLRQLRETLQMLHFVPDPEIEPSTRAIFKLALGRRIATLESEIRRRKMRDENIAEKSLMYPPSSLDDLSRSIL